VSLAVRWLCCDGGCVSGGDVAVMVACVLDVMVAVMVAV